MPHTFQVFREAIWSCCPDQVVRRRVVICDEKNGQILHWIIGRRQEIPIRSAYTHMVFRAMFFVLKESR